jgi:hypothetical protein
MRRNLVISVVLIAFVAWWLWPRKPETAEQASAARPAAGQDFAGKAPNFGTSETGWSADDFPLAAPLNAPGSSVARDLEALAQILEAWRTNFPRDGNPVGENVEIAGALAGANRLGLVMIPRGHPAFNAAGELCDRWGTPFRFHQLSGDRMEIRSAGPDRRFGTADDASWLPGQ